MFVFVYVCMYVGVQLLFHSAKYVYNTCLCLCLYVESRDRAEIGWLGRLTWPFL